MCMPEKSKRIRDAFTVNIGQKNITSVRDLFAARIFNIPFVSEMVPSYIYMSSYVFLPHSVS